MIGHWSNLRKLIYLYIIFNKHNNIITTIKGASPLSITNALAKPIKSLIQYGKIIQNGTPSPNTPVDLVCNNGTLKMVDDELPSGYKRLLGISFDGNFHYETGEYLTGDDDVTMTLDSLSSGGKNVFGSYNGTNNKNLSLYIYGSTNGSYFRYGDQLKRPKYGDTGRRTITFGKNGTTGFADDSEVTPDEFTTPANTYIGMLPNSSSAAYTGDIIGSITVSNRLEWIPCENPGGVIGYYEKYNSNFIAPTGSGTPVSLGYDTSHLVLGIVGTHEVLSVGTQTASVQSLFAVFDYADTQNIISGAVTHKVGVKVFDGTEAFTISGTAFRTVELSDKAANTKVFCSHFNGDITPTMAVSTMPDLSVKGYGPNEAIFFKYSDITTVADFKAYLAAQYAAGTPVIVIYPLAEEQDEKVAEQPLYTEKGENVINVISDVGAVELETSYYIEKH